MGRGSVDGDDVTAARADADDVGAGTPFSEEWEEAREMGRVAGGSLSEAMDASKLSIRLKKKSVIPQHFSWPLSL